MQPKINNEEEDSLMYEKEIELQEIEMTEARIGEVMLQEKENTAKDNTSSVLLKDIKKVRHYKTRNRSPQTLNPFFIMEKGKFIAGALIANTPGDNKHEQKSYLANMLRLPKSQVQLIQNLFYNGNGWYTIKLQISARYD